LRWATPGGWSLRYPDGDRWRAVMVTRNASGNVQTDTAKSLADGVVASQIGGLIRVDFRAALELGG